MANESVFKTSFKAIQTALEALEPLDITQREFALSMILKGLGMSASTGSKAQNGSEDKGNNSLSTNVKKMTAKEFLKNKKPHTDLERLICLAYYLTHVRDTPHFKTEDITALNTESASAKFSNASATARNAVSHSGFLSQAGGGKKQLTVLGEDAVTALPDRDALAKVLAEAPKRHRPRGKTKPKTKAQGNG